MDRIQNETYICNVVNEYSDMLYRLAIQRVRTREDAEDIVQEAFVRFIKNIPLIMDIEYAKAWLIRVTINLCKDNLKSAWRVKREAMPDNLVAKPVEKDDTLLMLIKKLPGNYRDAIYLFYYEEMALKEIATILGKKEMTVASYVHRGKKKLKNFLNGGDNSENFSV